MTSNNNFITAKRVIQNNQEFLIGTFQIRQIRNFTKYTQHLIVGFEEVDGDQKVFENQNQIKPIYNPEIQRRTNSSKVERIADFLTSDPNAMFPTNIVIAIPSQVIDDFSDEDGTIKLTLNQIVKAELEKEDGTVYLTIIDGQHRIKGIERAIERLNSEINDLSQVLKSSTNDVLIKKLEYQQKLLDRLLSFELLVTFFIDPTLEYQAMIFSTINKTQTKVPENLVYSLYGLTKDDSPQKTSLEVVLALNGIENSPFFNRIKLVGGNYKKGLIVPLSQATMVKSILNDISNNSREAETDRFKKRTELKVNPKNLTFRKYYANNQDYMIVRILYSYFNAVRNSFIDQNGNSFWEINTDGNISNILHTNVGFQALLKVLFDLLKIIPEEKRDDKTTYEAYLSKAQKINWADTGEQKRYPFTSGTINLLYSDIITMILK
ncbi:MAG: DGQHR domain-containing protein [Bacteroidales bacterium]|nr:DGQHR domain-containing protein [Bacteroidales bacterium]